MRNQAINLHLLDILYHVIAMTTDFKDNCLIHNFTVTVMNNVKDLLLTVLLAVRQSHGLVAVDKSRQMLEP